MEEREKRGERWKRASERRRETGGQEEKLGPRLVKRRHRKGETKQTTTGTTQEQLFVSFSFTLVFPRFFFKISFKNNKKNNKNKLTLKSQQLLARWRQDQSIHLATMWSIWNDKFHPSKTNEAFHFLFVLQSQPTQWLLLFVPVATDNAFAKFCWLSLRRIATLCQVPAATEKSSRSTHLPSSLLLLVIPSSIFQFDRKLFQNIDVIAQLCPKLSKVDVGLVMIKSDFFVMIEFGIDNMGVQIH